jgi:hypothetical protein
MSTPKHPAKKLSAEKEIPKEVEVVEVGVDPQTISDKVVATPPRKAAGEAVLAEVANTQVPVRTSWDEQQDLATHDHLAEESQRQARIIAHNKAIQDRDYMAGNV